jgi:hypothetical protein
MTSAAPKAHSEIVARLRAELEGQQDKALAAIVLHECGVIEETGGEEPLAARDYLAAFNADPQFREPLEALVRILTRRKSIKNLGKLLDALTRAAANPDERARAFWERSAYLVDYEKNLAAAKESLEEAVAANPEDPTPWLEIEILAAKDGDVAGRMRAIEARAELAQDPTWKQLLLIDLADLAARAGETARAYDLLDSAAALEGKARFRTRVALASVAQKNEDAEVLGRALEGQAELIAEALDDPKMGDEIGVPRYLREPQHAADAWYRAAELRRRSGQVNEAAGLIARAAQKLPESPLINRARMVALEVSGDPEAAAAIARRELERGVIGPGAASLWLRIAEAAALTNDRGAALGALRNALSVDPECIPARALEIDLLGDGQEPAALAASFEAAAETLATDDGKGRAFVMAAFVWAVRADDVQAAKVALSQAAGCGVPHGVVSRVARTLAALRGDTPWYEEATKRLLASGAEPSEQASLWFELGRSRLLRGDEAGASEAFAKLAGDGMGSEWLGRVLGAFAPALSRAGDGGRKASRAPEALIELAKVEPDPAMARGLMLVAALRSARGGDLDAARARLRELSEAAPADEVVAVFLAELDRRAGDGAAGAAALARCASSTNDGELAAALHIEAAILLWRAGDRQQALAELEASRGAAPKSAGTLLRWALAGGDADTTTGRRRALEISAESGGDYSAMALERFGLEVAGSDDGGGDGDEALRALDASEESAQGELLLAASLGRVLWTRAHRDGRALEHALDRLEQAGGEAAALARAERFRVSANDGDPTAAVGRAAAWARGEAELGRSSAAKLAAGFSWLGAAIAAEDREADAGARRHLARELSGDAAAAVDASAAMVQMLDQPNAPLPFADWQHASGRLMNLELALPGSDPRRRAAALHGLGDTLGVEAQLDAISLAAWSELAAGDASQAREAFQALVENRPDDVAAWEGLRAASEALADHKSAALAAAHLGALCRDDGRGAEFWEMAGLMLLEHTDAHDDAEIAFDRAFERNPRRPVAFDKLFRRVRARNEDDRLLDIIARRLQVADDDREIAKMYWERARVLRKKGDRDGALAALENVTMLEPDHVGALALAGEICITKGAFAEAAPLLARLSTIDEAPQQQRLMSGIAAVDLFENKLQQHDKALEVLVGLHRAGLSTLPVRERLAKSAAKAGAWREAANILEQLMRERDSREARVEAARLAMVIWRDKLSEPIRAEGAVAKLLEEAPDDGEALDLVLTTGYDTAFRTKVLGRAKSTLVQRLGVSPFDPDRVALLAKIAAAGQDASLRQATLGTLVALGRHDAGLSEELVRLDQRVAGRPQISLDATAMAEIADPDDGGPVAEIFAQMAETVSQAIGPSVGSLGVGRRERVEARGGHPVRVAVAEWMGALGFEGDFELYIGGHDPRGVFGVAGEQPAVVLGSGVRLPLDAGSRSAIAREVFALRRGITAVRTRDENMIASLAIAACNEVGISMAHPGYAVFNEVARSLKKEISRKVKKAIYEPCQRFAQSGQDARAWAAAARRSIDRMAVIAAGDVSIVLADVLGVSREQVGHMVHDSDRARRLIAFVLSPSYLDLRKKLGMGVR